jgi:hypothetical protein
LSSCGPATWTAIAYLDKATTYDFELENDPVSKTDCADGGWERYGFKNQGQCNRFVETGKDSR